MVIASSSKGFVFHSKVTPETISRNSSLKEETETKRFFLMTLKMQNMAIKTLRIQVSVKLTSYSFGI